MTQLRGPVWAALLLATAGLLSAAEPEDHGKPSALPTPQALEAILKDPAALAKLQAAARADRDAVENVSAVSKPQAVEAGPAGSGQVAARNEVTGTLRAPTEQEQQELGLGAGTGATPQVTVGPGGAVVSTVPPALRSTLVARKTADGRIEITERQGSPEPEEKR